MGKIPQGILGGVSGKIGGVVGSSWKGINVIKTKPLSVANPRTAGQVAQRSLFGNTVAFAVLILADIIKPLWDRFASKKSGYNEFIQTNINLFAGSSPFPQSDLIISKGKMAATPIDSVVASEAAGTVVVNWTDDSGVGFKLATDIVYALLINQTNGAVEAFETAIIRSAATAVLTPTEAFVASQIFSVYLAFKRADGSIVSNTAYKVQTAVA